MTLSFRNWLFGLALCSGVLSSATLVTAQQVPQSQQSMQASMGIRPIGKVNPAGAIDVVVTNSTSATLGVGFSAGANVKLKPGETTTLSFAAAPMNLFIYSFGQSIATKYNVALAGNTMNVEVTPMKTVASGDSALNISRTGMVYVN